MIDEKKKEFLNTEKKLFNDFREIYSYKENPIFIEYFLYKKAQENQIELEVYRRMFSAYCNKEREGKWLSKPLSKFFYRLEQRIEWVAQGLNRMDIFQIIQELGSISIIIAVITFLLEIPQRQEKAINEAWNVINSTSNNLDNYARINALQYLNKHKVNLSGISIQGANLRGIKLSNSRLTKSNLSNSILQNADLSNADLGSANLSGADLSNAILRGTKLEGVIYTYTTIFPSGFELPRNTYRIGINADLNRVKLNGINLREVNLTGAELRKAELKGANFSGSYLRKATLDNADLTGANLTGVSMENAHLKNALLIGARIDGAFLRQTNLEQANLSFTDLRATNLSEANLNGANLQKADLLKANLANTNLSKANLRGSTLEYALNVDKANLCNATMPDGKISKQGCSEK
jgi:uncharacterized protein YjbI with pentapeptide repeats